MKNYVHEEIFQFKGKKIEFELLSKKFISVDKYKNKEIITLDPRALELLAEKAFTDVAHYLRPSHLKKVRKILDDDEASENDKYVALALLKNANVAAGGELPMCQDTGTAIILAKKGENILTGGKDEESLSRGIYSCYQKNNLRYSQMSALSMYDEINTKNNLPAQIDIYQSSKESYEFLFIAKGGGSANKTFFYQPTPSILKRDSLEKFLISKIHSIGTAACPPYHLGIVIGGLSAEMNLKTLKLATCQYLNDIPVTGNTKGRAFRDLLLETKIMELTQKIGVGAQFGGKYFCHDVRVIRLPRHGASLPISIGVSCGADRQVIGKINRDGIYIEKLEKNPARYLPEITTNISSMKETHIDLNKPIRDTLKKLSSLPIKTRVSLSGYLIVARDIAHSKIRERIKKENCLPSYFKNYPIYYAGPAKKPKGMVTGSFGPTTAGRMDSYVEEFQSLGGSLIMLAKGNRSRIVKESCKKYSGFYLGSIGGPGADLAENYIKEVECIEYPELGMEAIWKIKVENFPAFIIIDDKGNDFFDSFKVD